MTTKTKKPPKTASKAKTHKVGANRKAIGAKKSGAEGKDTKEKAKVGRPSKKTPELLKAICSGIAEGKSSRAMCIEVGINRDTLLEWLAADAEFSGQYARAKELSADFHAEGLIELSDEKPEVKLEDGKIIIDPQFAQTQRLRFDARKWYASKLAPKKYGDKLDMNHGVQPDNPLADLMGKIVGSDTGRIRPAS